MTTRVNFPKSGMGIEDGVLAKWLKQPGERVSRGEIIAQIEIAKAVQDVEAPVDGTLVKLLVAEGETALVNTDIAEIEES